MLNCLLNCYTRMWLIEIRSHGVQWKLIYTNMVDQNQVTWRLMKSNVELTASIGCHSLHPSSPFIIITEPESWYSFYHSMEGRTLSQPGGWWHTTRCPQTVTHPGTNRVYVDQGQCVLSFSFFLIWGDTCSLCMPVLRPASQSGPMHNPREGTSVVLHDTIWLTLWCV